MSRHLAAYFAVVGTLASASVGAASAGPVNIPQINIPRPQVNIPHINISRPQISVPTPRLSSPNLTTHNFSVPPPPLSGRKLTTHILKETTPGNNNNDRHIRMRESNLTPGTGTFSGSGRTSANPVSNTGGDSFTPLFPCRAKGGVSNCPG